MVYTTASLGGQDESGTHASDINHSAPQGL